MRWTDTTIAGLPSRGCTNVLGGLGLYIRVGAGGAKSYIARYSYNGKRHEMGLGSTRVISFLEAVEAVLNVRNLVTRGDDPLLAHRRRRAAPRLRNDGLPISSRPAARYGRSTR